MSDTKPTHYRVDVAEHARLLRVEKLAGELAGLIHLGNMGVCGNPHMLHPDEWRCLTDKADELLAELKGGK